MLADVVLLGIQLFAALYLERFMASYVALELLAIGAGILLSFGIFIVAWNKQMAAWKASLVFYVLALANLTFVWWQVGGLWIPGFAFLAALIGIVRSIGKMESTDEMDMGAMSAYTSPKLETYSTSPKEQHVDVDPMYVNLARDDWKNAVRKSSVVTPARKRGRPKGSKNKRN